MDGLTTELAWIKLLGFQGQDSPSSTITVSHAWLLNCSYWQLGLDFLRFSKSLAVDLLIFYKKGYYFSIFNF